MEERIDALGLVQVGEVTTRAMKEVVVEPDNRNAHIAGGVQALQSLIEEIMRRLQNAGPYDDTRQLMELITWARDQISKISAGKDKPYASQD